MTRHTFVRRSAFAMLVALTVATLWPSELLAQRAVPRSAPRTGVAVPRPPSGGHGYYRPYYPYYGYYYPRYYYPYFYGGFYTPFYWGAYWGPYWGGGYPYYYGAPYYGGYYYDNSGSARLQISPRDAQVYVDGYFAGLVDNFDGNLQRLNVESGEHELQVGLLG